MPPGLSRAASDQSGAADPNSPPALNNVSPDKQSPQDAGAVIVWTATATDPDNDPILYRFLLKGPSTDNKFVEKQAWGNDKTWTWTTTDADAGGNQVQVQVRDGNHAQADSYDDSKNADYTINARPVAVTTPPAPTVTTPSIPSPTVPSIETPSVPSTTTPAAPPAVAIPENKPPAANSLAPDKPSPQVAGTTVVWIASTSDPDNDPVLYRFLLNGPSTGNNFAEKRGWSNDNSWTWITTDADVGSNQVQVQVRDGNHAPADSYDSNKIADYTINAKPAAVTTPPAPTVTTPSIPSPTIPSIESPSLPSVETPSVPSIQTPTAPVIPLQPAVPENKPPAVNTLAPDKPSPQDAGTAIVWTASATDPDNDPIFYRFLLMGPSTGNNFVEKRGWSNDNTWTWTTTDADVGNNQVQVQVRDGNHAPPSSFDDSKTADYTINAKPAPITVTPSTPVPTPTPTPTVTTPTVTTPENKPPVVNSLTPDRPSPQVAGTAVVWTASASDPDNDPVLYRFLLNGPSTGNNFAEKRGWSNDNSWTWITTDADVGGNQVQVQVRDGNHAPADSYDSNKIADYTINARPAAVTTPPAPTVTTPSIPSPTIPSIETPSLPSIETPSVPSIQTPTAPVTPLQPAVPENKPPAVNTLAPDKPSPQVAGTTIVWTANATDPDNDPVFCRFLLKESTTGSNFMEKRGWSNDNTWTWITTNADIGSDQVQVQVRDGKHAPANGYDSNNIADFIINPQAVAPVTPVAPAPVTSVVNVTTPTQTPTNATTTPSVTTPVIPAPANITVPVSPLAPGNVTPGTAAGQAPVAPTKPNQTPVANNLVPDKQSPQAAGAIVTWTASASDPDNDPILYRFMLQGPATKNQLVNETGWVNGNTWTWTTTIADVGSNRIQVQVRDGFHAGPESFDSSKDAQFTITAPITAPVTAPITNVTTPAPANITIPVAPSVTNVTIPAPTNITAPIVPPVINVTVPTVQNITTPVRPPVLNVTVPVPVNATRPAATNVTAPIAPITPIMNITIPVSPAANITANVTAPVPVNVTVPIIPPANATTPAALPVNVTVPGIQNVTAPAIAPTNVTANITAPTTAPTTGVNLPPAANSLVPDKLSPQVPGTTITWTANATDPDNGDQILYRFFLNGPSTNGAWTPQTDWIMTNTWAWKTSFADAGSNQIRVGVRDGKHAGVDSSDSEQIALFTIKEQSRNITGFKFDQNNKGLAGWTIKLTRPDGTDVSTLTGQDGSFAFNNLALGDYTLSEVQQTGWSAVTPSGGSQKVTLADKDAAGINFVNKVTAFSISGKIFNDLNNNGINDGEPGLAGWTLILKGPSGTTVTNATRADGSYLFEGLAPGAYTVSETVQSGWTQTAPKAGSYQVTISNAGVTGQDFGNGKPSYSISGTAYSDLNSNGQKDSGDPGLAGWSISLQQGGSLVNATTTGSDGSYIFRNVASGSYTVSETVQNGWAVTAPSGGSYQVTLTNADITGRDFGNRGNLSVAGAKYYDINGNGVRDEGEPGIPNENVSLLESGKVVASKTTGQDGSYTFSNLPQGTYTISDPVSGGFVLTTSSTITVSVTTTVVVNANFGLKGTHAIAGVKYNDLNSNHVKDAGEPGISGWGIALSGSTFWGAPISRQTTTDANGAYSFANLCPGTYTISELSRPGWVQTAPASGSYTVPVSFSSPAIISGNDFGNTAPSQSISGVKYNDLNNNHVRDAGEPGLAGWTIRLENPLGTVKATTTTGPDGSYIFTSLTPGDYYITEVLQPHWTQTAPTSGNYHVTLGSSAITGQDFGNSNPLPINPTLTPNYPSPQGVGIPITWTASATSANPLQYRFFVRGPAPFNPVRVDTGYGVSNVWTWDTRGFQPGTYQVEVWIRDGLHAGPGSFDVHAVANFVLAQSNLPPQVEFLYPDRPAPQYAGAWIGWKTAAFDPDGDQILYRYFLRGPSTGGFWVDQTGWTRNSRWIWRTTGFDIGPSEVLVLVRDGHHAGPGGWDDFAVEDYLILGLNVPPVIKSITNNVPSPQPAGALVQWKATAYDPEPEPLFFRFWLRGPSTGGAWRLVQDWSTANTWNWYTSLADAGVSTVDIQVRDGYHAGPDGWDDDASALFTILPPNKPPVLTDLAPNKPSPQLAGVPVAWTAPAYDPDKDPILYRFWLKGPSTGNAWKIAQDWSYSASWTWISSLTDVGDYSVYVYARDGKHAGTGGYDSAKGATFTLLFPNKPPMITDLLPDKQSPQYAGSTVSWKTVASDPDGDPILYRFWLKGPSTGNAWKVVQDWSYNSIWTWASSPADIGDYSVYVYIRDGKHAGTGGYDSAIGQPYTLLNPMAVRKLTMGSAAKDQPSLIFAGDGYLMAYQSMELGPGHQGDIAVKKLDQSWNTVKGVWVTNDTFQQSSPTAIFANGFYYVAYVSNEKGSSNIFVKKYDPNLNPVETRQLTATQQPGQSQGQDSPSLTQTYDGFVLAYRVWDQSLIPNGAIFLTKLDGNWNPVSTVQLIGQGQTKPSVVFAGGSLYVAYDQPSGTNLNIFVTRLDKDLNFLESKRLTINKGQDLYPALNWVNGQFMQLYSSTKGSGNLDVFLDRYLRDWTPIDSTMVVSGNGDQTWPSLAYSPIDGMYWTSYVATDTEGKNIYLKPTRLASPSQLKNCDITFDFSLTKAGSPYTLTVKFYNNYGELTDPMDLSFGWTPQDAATGQTQGLQKVSTGVFQMKSSFGAAGDKAFRIQAEIDGCYGAKIVPVKAV